jgi:hypothetical protein
MLINKDVNAQKLIASNYIVNVSQKEKSVINSVFVYLAKINNKIYKKFIMQSNW